MTIEGLTKDGCCVEVGLGARSYEILIDNGLLDRAGALVASRHPQAKAAIITDSHVADCHLSRLARSLEAAGVDHSVIILQPGEATKSFAVLGDILDRLIADEIERGDIVLALGGGVVGDIAGFAAAILRRGTGFIQIPTTLLAQVDSSVGGKTAINSPRGKNLIGTFHQPTMVLIDPETLATLAVRERRAGYAEVVKYAVIGDAPFFDWLVQNGAGVIAGTGAALNRAIEASVRAKAAIVAADEREAGERALLNLGHTFGHALEAATGYDGRLLHGEAVAVGMVLALMLSADLGLAPPSDAARLKAHLNSVGLPGTIHDIEGVEAQTYTSERLLAFMRQDKKARCGVPAFILGPIGGARIVPEVPEARIADVLARSFAGRL